MDVDCEVSAAAAAAVTNGLGGEGQPSAAPVSADQLDVEAYAAQYSGRTRVARLLFIAERCGVEAIQLEALRMAHDEARAREDTVLYLDAVLKINGRLGPRYRHDQAWVDSVNRRAEQRKEKLETELNGYRTNLIKESIRMGYNDIGDFFYAHGHLSEAFKSYIRTRDYCTTSKHIVQMCMHVILVSIELGQFAHVTNYVSKAEQTPDTLDAVIVAKLRAAAGLANLETKKYKLAARKFLETGPELGSNYSEVIAPQDVAVCGALCALASFDRSELKSKVIDNINFRNFLELVPEVRELVNDFYASRYGSCLEHLEKLKPNLLLDIHLHLNTMASAFKSSVSMLEKELAALITENKIQARIDSHNKILYARHADQRNATFQRALQTGNEFERDIKAMLLRANLIKHDFNQKNWPGQRKMNL
ncbi:hypothetical protein VPH35_087052 [Triticum aestivum]